MNKHVHKVIEWLEDPESVSQKEREENRGEDASACSAAQASYDDIGANAAYAAAYFAADNNPELATKWVSKYFARTGEDKQDYLDAIEEEKVGSKKEPASVYVKEYKGLSVPSGATTDTSKELSERVKVIGREHYFYTEIEDFEKQPRYKGNDGLDWIDEFSRDNSIEYFRAAMRFTIGKYEKRLGKKDAMSKELYKISDYYKRWSEVEKKLEGE